MATHLQPVEFLRTCHEQACNPNWANTDAFTFINDRGDVSDTLTHLSLWRQSGAIAASLLNRLKPGDRVLMVYMPGLEFVLALLACLRTGLIPVPIAPPDFTQNGTRAQEESRKFVSIATASGAIAVLTDSAYHQTKQLNAVRTWFRSWIWSGDQSFTWPDLPWIVTDGLRRGQVILPDQIGIDPDPSALAFLQYTSGSTSDPKGVRSVMRFPHLTTFFVCVF